MALATTAGTQHGLVTIAQLLAVGLSESGVRKRVTRGQLHRIHRGVYALGHAALSREGQWLAAVLAAGEGAALSHLAAAKLFEVWRRRAPRRVDVVSPRVRKLRAIRIHESRRLDPRDVTVFRGIPVTTVARMLVDLTDELTAEQLANVIHEAAFRNRFDLAAACAAMERANGRRRLGRLEGAIALHLGGSAGTKSGNEDRFLELIRRTGLPDPIVNGAVEGIEVDFHWLARRLCVEIDGRGHQRPLTILDDKRRDQRLAEANYTVLRFTDGDVKDRPAWVLGRVRAALA